MGKKHAEERNPPKEKTPTFLLELPLVADAGQAARLGSHLEVGRQFYNAVLSTGQRRLRRMRADPAWQAARTIPRTRKQERKAAFSALRERYGFSEYAFHELARKLRVAWLAEHLDTVLAQTLASRAYRALNRVCLGKARRVRFKSKSRGLDSIENKRNDTGMRFVLQPGAAGRPQGYLLWHDDQLAALIDWDDPVVAHGLAHEIKYARLVRRRTSSPRAQGADREGERYCVQLVLTGLPHHKPKHAVGSDTIGLDLGPASLAIVPREAEARLVPLCAELRPDARAIRRLQRRMERQRRAATKRSHYCHGCGAFVPKPLWQRWHQCPCGVGPVQRDLYSAFLAAYLDPADPTPSCAQYVIPWEGAEARLLAAHERATQRANEGQVVPRSMGISRAGARLPKSPGEATQELLFLSSRGKVEAWKHRPEPPGLQPGESSAKLSQSL